MGAASPQLVQCLCCFSLEGPKNSLLPRRNVPISLKLMRARRVLLTRCYTLQEIETHDQTSMMGNYYYNNHHKSSKVNNDVMTSFCLNPSGSHIDCCCLCPISTDIIKKSKIYSTLNILYKKVLYSPSAPHGICN